MLLSLLRGRKHSSSRHPDEIPSPPRLEEAVGLLGPAETSEGAVP